LKEAGIEIQILDKDRIQKWAKSLMGEK